MKPLLTAEDRAKLLENGHCTAGERQIDPPPVVHLFVPGTGASWLLTELDPDDGDRAFGLCDLGMGFVELGSVRLSEIEGLRTTLGLTAERDNGFVATGPLSAYSKASWRAERMVTQLPSVPSASSD